MSKYTISQAGRAVCSRKHFQKQTTIEAADHETAYRAMCCWYNPGTPITVTDTETGAAETFTRILDSKGNLQGIERAKA